MNLDSLLDHATRCNVAPLLWGPPGVGKSAAIKAWAADRELPCWTVIASLRDPADFGGLPIISSNTMSQVDDATMPSVTFAPPRFAVEAARSGGVIFLDELTTAPPAVQAALLRAVLDHAFGDLELDPTRVTLVAAANPPSEAAGGWDLAPPLANRFLHFNFPLVTADWVDQFPGYWGSPLPLSFRRENVDTTRWMRARILVATFIRTRPTLLLDVPQHDSQRGMAWPSPRTWDFASRLLASVEQAGGELTDALPLLSGCVGEGPALEFVAWGRELDLPDPEELLAQPGAYRHAERGDLAYATLNAVTQAALQRLTPERWTAGWRILSAAAAAGGADIAASSARKLARARKPDLPLPAKELAAFMPVLQEAGLLAAA